MNLLLRLRWRALFLIAVFCCASTTLAAAGAVVLPAESGRVLLNPVLSWWTPSSADVDFAAAQQALQQHAFVPAPPGPGYGLRSAPVWFHAAIRHDGGAARALLLEIAFTKLDFVDVYVRHPDGRVEHWRTGEALPFSTRPLGSPRFLFPLQIATAEQVEVFLRIESSTIINLPLTVFDAHEYLNVASHLHGWLGVFYGLVLGLLAYNAFLFRTTRVTAFLHYVIGGTLAVGYFLSMDGYLAAWLPERPGFAQSLLFLFGTLSVTFTLLFARGFLELARLSPRLDHALLGVAIAAAAGALLVPLLPPVLAMGVTIAFSVLMAVLMSAAGVVALRSGFRPARWFVLAITIHLLVLLLVTLAVLAVFPGLLAWADIAHRAGFVLNLLCFTLAIGDRIQHLDSDRRAAENRAISAAADARARDEFLSRMSHELRTPMTGVLGMTELLEHTELAPTQRKYLATLRYSGEMLLNLINDILDHARMQTGRLQPRREAFDLLRVLDDCRTLFEQQPRDGNVALAVDIGGGLSRVAVGDAQRLRQVLIDLLAQAFRQTARGNVVLRVRALDAPGWVRFEVAAAALPAADAARLHDELVGAVPLAGRMDRALGLAICRQLVDLMGGRIGFSGDEQGAAGSDRHALFWFELPLNTGS